MKLIKLNESETLSAKGLQKLKASKMMLNENLFENKPVKFPKTDYYIRVKEGVELVNGKVKEFEDGVKIGIHETPYEKVASDVRTGYKIIGTGSPLVQGEDNYIYGKKNDEELFNQAYDLLKSIDQDYYNSLPNAVDYVENLTETKKSTDTKIPTKRGPYKKRAPKPLSYEKIYDSLEKLGYDVYASHKGGLYVRKAKESNLSKAKEYLDSNGIPYTVEYKGYPKKYVLEFDVPEDTSQNESLREASNRSIEEVKSILRPLVTKDGKVRALRDDEKLPRGFQFKSGTDTSGEVTYEGTDYAYAVVNGKLKVMTSAEAGDNWSETIYKEDLDNIQTAVDKIFSSGDEGYPYAMLDRMKSDCEYYLGYGNRSSKYLWAKDPKQHIEIMKAIYNRLDPKPEWLTIDKINEYEKNMLEEPLEYDSTVKNESFEDEHLGEVSKKEFTVTAVDKNGSTYLGRVKAKDNKEAEDKFLTYKNNNDLQIAGSHETTAEDVRKGIRLIEELIPETPNSVEPGPDAGIASQLNKLIIDEWDAIQGYNDAIVAAELEGYHDIAKVFKDIVNEEMNHVGMLETALSTISPNTQTIKDGEVEASDILEQ